MFLELYFKILKKFLVIEFRHKDTKNVQAKLTD